MNFIKAYLIKNSKYGNKYSKLLIENSLHNFKDLNELYKNSIFLDSIFKSIIYGNSKSKCKKKLTLHTRLNNLFEEDKHQISTEFENVYRLKRHYHIIAIFCIFIILLTNYLSIIL
jgi:hypothetical protein